MWTRYKYILIKNKRLLHILTEEEMQTTSTQLLTYSNQRPKNYVLKPGLWC